MCTISVQPTRTKTPHSQFYKSTDWSPPDWQDGSEMCRRVADASSPRCLHPATSPDRQPTKQGNPAAEIGIKHMEGNEGEGMALKLLEEGVLSSESWGCWLRCSSNARKIMKTSALSQSPQIWTTAAALLGTNPLHLERTRAFRAGRGPEVGLR